MALGGFEEIIRVGDIGDTFQAETGEDLTGAAVKEIWVDRLVDQVWVNQKKITCSVVGDATDGVMQGKTTTAFAASGLHRRYAYVEWDASNQKKGTPSEFWVYD